MASSSPRRRTLLAEAGYEFRVDLADVQETAPAHLTVRETVLFNAKTKAENVASRHADSVVIGADTLVAIEGKPFGKPRDSDEAFAMLSRLSGQTHEVFSGVWIVCRTKSLARGFVETSHVRFRELSPDEIRAYMAQVHTLDKAGAYAAQEDPTGIIAEIHGSRSNVIGLPMETLRRTLREFRRSRADLRLSFHQP